ncbi:hypothetical protein PF005_g7006 [Phytophthora fragariae]|uniref:Uncharacterized protein n=1 Tax=Phytophthora fragariae TaxID=53985 RepID=A0A6A3L1R7_9STRA|nr:hypothetical protein PF009_g10561 [Phytophthora fragariae]KAE9011865.1 hypothetical protein PF011_g9184 [Phytophthora fragariae]KAE9110923.1 hypothetical protein PF010_g11001 [Phytophthora fragariae]KAE9116309.1 hypothetical protein PF007_g9710 [Phytophthora fragariae]KAE9145436.1 hypothetical protein PF006_g9712 [Phytophthora fragariae]
METLTAELPQMLKAMMSPEKLLVLQGLNPYLACVESHKIYATFMYKSCD